MADLTAAERRRRGLWWLAAALLVGFALTVAALSVSQADRIELALLPRETFGALLAAMIGLVVLFVLYGTWLHDRLLTKERELQQAAAHELVLRERLGELAALFETSSELARKLDLHDVLRLAAARVVPCLEADHSSVHILNPRTQQLEEVAWVGRRLPVPSPARPATADGLLGYVYATRQALTADSEETRARVAAELGLPETPQAVLCVPMRFEEACLGVLCVARLEVSDPFAAIHARALQALADHCGAAIVKDFHFRRIGPRQPRAA